MGNFHTCPALFNFLNGMGMRIVFNKWLNGMGMRIVFNKRGRVGMGATRREHAPLPFLFHKFFIYLFFKINKYASNFI